MESGDDRPRRRLMRVTGPRHRQPPNQQAPVALPWSHHEHQDRRPRRRRECESRGHNPNVGEGPFAWPTHAAGDRLASAPPAQSLLRSGYRSVRLGARTDDLGGRPAIGGPNVGRAWSSSVPSSQVSAQVAQVLSRTASHHLAASKRRSRGHHNEEIQGAFRSEGVVKALTRHRAERRNVVVPRGRITRRLYPQLALYGGIVFLLTRVR